MELVKSVMNNRLVKYMKRYCVIFTVDLSAAISLVHLWNKGYKYLVPTATLCCIGEHWLCLSERSGNYLPTYRLIFQESIICTLIDLCLVVGGSYLYCRIKSRDKISPNQAVIIIGCDSGLGYSLALYCRQLGATVIASVLQIDGHGAKKLQQEGVHVFPLDVTDFLNLSHFVDSVRALLKEQNLELRCLINNAAVMIFGEFEWQTHEQIERQVQVNLLGAMRITRELMPMIRAHSSRIIVISSHCKIQPIPGVATYSGTKAGLTAWATALRLELKKYGVKVICFIPGSFINESKIMAGQAEHFKKMMDSMPKETKDFYANYFNNYRKYFSSVSQATKLEKLQDPRIYEEFEGALLDKYPSAIYKNESWRYFIYHTLFAITPSCLSDILVLKFVQGPPWNGPGAMVKNENTEGLQSK